MAHVVDLHVGQRLRHRRWEIGMTQAELADAIGIRFQQVQKYEAGTNRISASRLWDIGQAVDVPMSYFFDGLGGAAAPLSEAETLIRLVEAMPAPDRRRLHDFAHTMSLQGAAAS